MERKDFLKLFSLSLFPSELIKTLYIQSKKTYYIEMVEKSVTAYDKSFEFHEIRKIFYSQNNNEVFVSSKSFKEKDFFMSLKTLFPEGKDVNFIFSKVNLNLFSLEKGKKFPKENAEYFRLIIHKDGFKDEEIFRNLNSKNRFILKNKLNDEHNIIDYDFKESIPVFFNNSSFGKILLRLIEKKCVDRVFFNLNFEKNLPLNFKKDIKNKPKRFIVVKDLSFKDEHVVLKGNFLIDEGSEFLIPQKLVIDIDEFFKSLYLTDRKREVYVAEEWRFFKIAFYNIYLYGKKGVIL